MRTEDISRRIIFAAALSVLICGCADDGPYALSGAVIYDGKPVPKGFVTLTPEPSSAHAGPEVRVAIEGGWYHTGEGQGIGGGPYRVRIVGFDGVATRWQGEDLPDGKSLFSPYQTTVDFPRQDGEFNFAIQKAGDKKK
jgi:hypothetical protein